MKFILLALAFIGMASAVYVAPYGGLGYSSWGHAPVVSAYSAPVVSAYSAPVYGAGLGYGYSGFGYGLWKKKA
ncbi:unnamed protein product [Hermetia illucens]|uniref:Uncharacterized protein n=1 Tax=Hermetia illucens TaxID=343691 RepID=A0A7R8UHC3_HERIL|nr:unnamed protein product [Hermetia illucens]